jgi:hypothetical protein
MERTGRSFNHRLLHDLKQPPRLRDFGASRLFLDRAAFPSFKTRGPSLRIRLVSKIPSTSIAISLT